jgi:hypothetical protein|tara:strand:- start:648 stop:1082 length:435 start_codon:yes stop_codon:yes gene_type:complete
MNGITLLIIVVFVGYFYENRYPQPTKYKVYFGIGCTIFLTFLYFMNYQQPFVYKMAKNVRDIQSQPLHTSVPDFQNTINSDNVKYQLANRQGLRCPNCKNPIMLEDINSYKMSYLIPLDQGGSNDPTNLKLICPTCYQFKNNIY